MAPVVTYARSAKRKRARLDTPTTSPGQVDVSEDTIFVKRRKTYDFIDDEEVNDSEPERETSLPIPDNSNFNSSSATQVGQEDDAMDEEVDSLSARGTQQRSVILVEDANLQIIGEVDPASLSDNSDEEDEEDTIPVRELYDFEIYDLSTRDRVHVGALRAIEYSAETYGASGLVKPHKHREIDFDEDDEGDVLDEEEVDDSLLGDSDQYEQFVELTQIKQFDVHHVPSGRRKSLRLDGMLHLIVKAALNDPRTTEDKFVADLEVKEDSANSIAIARKMLGRDLTASDLHDDGVKAYVLGILDDLQDARINIEKVPLIRTLRGKPILLPPRPSSGKKRPSQTSRSKDLEIEVLKHRNPTVVTPIVKSIGDKLFHGLSAAGHGELDVLEDDTLQKRHRMHRGNPASIRWECQPDENGLYKQVIIDGVAYSVGDSVAVLPGIDDDKTRAANHHSSKAQTRNTLGNTMWFCRICYMYEENGSKRFHGQWYSHGSKMLLQEVAHPQSLFLLDTCDPIDLATIVQKCNVRELAFDETEPPVKVDSDDSNFFTGFMLIERDSSFIYLTSPEVEEAVSICEDGKVCLACALRERKKRLQDISPQPPRAFSVRGVKYHAHDFVYLLPEKDPSSLIYSIGQIVKVNAMAKPPTISVRRFGRYDDVARRQRRKAEWHVPVSTDERCLFQTDEVLQEVSMESIDGKCYARQLFDTSAIDEWVKHPNHFYFNRKAESWDIKTTSQLQKLGSSKIPCCETCMDEHIQNLAGAERLLQKHGPLRGLELFAGAGGLGTGFDESGFVNTRWAVEFSPSAALTYRTNHPETIVYNQCSNVMLQDALDERDGKARDRPRDLHTGHELPMMPKRGEVDIIFGGPPCQSFSGANHHKKADDIRSTLVCNMISYVEFYRPMYFLLENVLGLLHYKLLSRMIGQAFDPNQGIEMGVLKFITRSLTALGYQVRFKVCQAGQYGAPQGRRRVLFWGAKRGCPLPEFPMPTHGFKGSNYHKLPDGTKLPPPSRSLDPDEPHQIAPFYPVTITDAIGDLPPFDWGNPRLIIRKPSPKDKAEDKARSRLLPSFDAVISPGYSSYPGYTRECKYTHQALSRYQMSMRAYRNSETVSYQYTLRFGAGIVERVVSVPMQPGAFHNDLPPLLRMSVKSRNKGERNFTSASLRLKALRSCTDNQIGLYGRMDGEGHFKTAMTTVAPNRKGGDVLHPSQKRIITVRECARAQGFPDHYQFLSANEGLNKTVLDVSIS
ncbi:hypothetical protein HWV62_42606 [Athelia sp. TMB]|nr:hypothetical protein HWV62_42606 [Athelia sp. TMB]